MSSSKKQDEDADQSTKISFISYADGSFNPCETDLEWCMSNQDYGHFHLMLPLVVWQPQTMFSIEEQRAAQVPLIFPFRLLRSCGMHIYS